MAQHDYNIANQGFASFRSDLNNALSAIQTNNSGTSRPTGAVAGQLWLDTTSATTPTLKYYDGADDISLATIDHTANTVNWLDSTVSITGLSTTATGTVLTLSDTATTSTVNLIIDNDKEIRFREATANGTNYISLSSPASLSADFTLTLPEVTDTLVTKTSTDILTNKTLTSPVISSITNTGTLTLPTSSDTLVGRATTDTLTNKTVTNPTITNYVESVVSIGTVTTSNTISLTNGTVQTATLTASTACTFTMPTATAGKSFVLLLKQASATGNGTATFTGVKFGSSGSPTITATAGKMDILTFVSDGTNWYGSASQGFTP
jgi:hypothetical protein